ncbi:hypothetical protein [Fictibacillus sp. BK138]|uniref:hypothetical protein n=1 Tax=Fictibacillus sp. BK138 TaxID=2512121 RepID=UPI0010E22FE6|nr:hypothetical protein [Fictibacillus sp. BK138]RZT21347.1 hypothetical protein EV282_0406 [Fictibacillus sp. BK138]
MGNNKLEYIKVACLVMIAVSLSIIALNIVNQISVLEGIQDKLDDIQSGIMNINNN